MPSRQINDFSQKGNRTKLSKWPDLDVALADDAQVADDLDGARPEHVVFSVGSDR